ncbi:MAG: transposase [Anaerolineae bacterium]
MSIIPELPEFVIPILNAHLNALLLWFSDYVYTQLLKRAQDELLARLHPLLDFTAVETACAGYHHTAGPGAPPTHPVPRLVRALLVRYLFDWSYRQLEFQIRFNLLVKWFVGYAIFAAGPDHTTLERFEVWVEEHQHRTYFDAILHQIDADFPEERDKPQIGDTFAMQANAAKESLVRLIRHACQRLLSALAAVDPEAHARVTARLDHAALFGTSDEPSEYRLDQAGRQQRLQATVRAALHCAQLVQAQLDTTPGLSADARHSVTDWLQHLDKILGDEVRITPDPTGEAVLVTELPKDQKGSYRIGSATDPDATYRVHDDQVDFGYNISLAATETFIREIRADTGAQPDAVAIPDLLTAQSQHHDLTPDKLIYDAAAGTGKTYARVREATAGQTQLVSPLISHEKPTGRFGPEDFTLSEDGTTLTCPNGQSSDTAYRSGSGEGRNFRFFADQCAGCPFWDQCRDPEANPHGMRQVFISDHRPLVEAAKAYNQTDDFKADMKLRPLIERIIAALTRYNGARRARSRGQPRADFQAKMNATAANIKRWLRLRDLRHGLAT